VLLKTTPGALPIAASAGRVLLAGRGADDIGVQSGGWTITWQGSEGAITPGTTIAAAMRAELGDRLAFATDGAFPSGTRAPTGVVVVAEPPYAEGRGDSGTLTLPPADLEVVARVRPLVDRLIVVVISGRPVMLDGILPAADAVVAAWLPGTEGSGVADGLLGAVPFTATTPDTWPTRRAPARAGARERATRSGTASTRRGACSVPPPARRPERGASAGCPHGPVCAIRPPGVLCGWCGRAGRIPRLWGVSRKGPARATAPARATSAR
jgi:hypothetical protein